MEVHITRVQAVHA